jgi:glycosyltransferase involved in cell wall biosynthesis
VYIGLIIYGSLDTLSGGYLYDRMLVRYLRQAGDRVEIISQPWRPYLLRIPQNRSTSLQHKLLTTPFDVLLQDELNHASLVALNRSLRDTIDYPIVSVVHHLRCSEARPAWQNRAYRQVEARYLKGIDGFIFNSAATRDTVERLAQIMRPHVVAPPAGNRIDIGITEDEIAERARLPGPLNVLFIGNLIPRKGLHTLIEALAHLPASSWHLTAVGSLTAAPGYVARLRRQIQRAGLTRQVTLTGRLPDSELSEHLLSSHLLAMPSSYEGFGIAYLEAMAFGLAAIGSTAGGAREVITHRHNGFLVPPDDTNSLAHYLNLVASDRDRLLSMSLAARRTFVRQPTWAHSAGRIRRFLLELTSYWRR